VKAGAEGIEGGTHLPTPLPPPRPSKFQPLSFSQCLPLLPPHTIAPINTQTHRNKHIPGVVWTNLDVNHTVSQQQLLHQAHLSSQREKESEREQARE